MNFSDLSADQAEAYRRTFESDGPTRLFELARFLERDGVDLVAFDATIPSLVDLWAWYVPFTRAGFPGVRADARGRIDDVLGDEAGDPRADYAAELLDHYLFEVARNCFANVAWVTNDYVGMESSQRTAVRYIDDDGHRGLAHLDRFTGGATRVVQEGRASFMDPRYLADAFLVGPFLCGDTTAARVLTLPRRDSILQPSDLPPQNEDHTDGDELLLAHRKADIEALEQAKPLNLAAVTKTLAELGFVDIDGAPPSKASILAQEFADFVRADDAAMVTTLVAGGKLRSLQIASVSATVTAWEEITDRFTRLAGTMNARLAREDEF